MTLPAGVKKRLREWLEALAAAALVTAAFYCLCWPVQINGESMRETFAPGQLVLVSRLLVGGVGRGDVVLCRTPYGSLDVIKRLVALPGDRVRIEDGQVFLNGAPLHEPYLREPFTKGAVDLTLGEGEYFLLGDNRAVSIDSRAVGVFHKDLLEAKVLVW
jgi:signal peptidase I